MDECHEITCKFEGQIKVSCGGFHVRSSLLSYTESTENEEKKKEME